MGEGVLVRLRVRLLRRVRSEGDPGRSSTVFCPERGRSVEVDVCQLCPRLSRAGDAAIECTPVSCGKLEDLGAVLRLGGNARVGDAMGHYAVAVLAELPAAAVTRCLVEEGTGVAIVVDDEGHLVGLVEAAAAAQVPGATPARRLARPVVPVHESAPLALAVDRMVRERARALPVVDDGGCVVALLTDLDALRWVAQRGSP